MYPSRKLAISGLVEQKKLTEIHAEYLAYFSLTADNRFVVSVPIEKISAMIKSQSSDYDIKIFTRSETQEPALISFGHGYTHHSFIANHENTDAKKLFNYLHETLGLTVTFACMGKYWQVQNDTALVEVFAVEKQIIAARRAEYDKRLQQEATLPLPSSLTARRN